MGRKHLLLAIFPAAFVISTGIVLALAVGTPTLSRDQAIGAALDSRGVPLSQRESQRVEAKLIHRFDLQGAVGSMAGSGNPFDRLWVIAVSGDFGVESTMVPGRNTWGIAVVPDRLPAGVEAYLNDNQGDWPPFWQRLPDLDPTK